MFNLSDRSPTFPPQLDAAAMAMGQYGGVIIDTTATHTGPFCAVQALVDSTFASGTTMDGFTGSLTGKIIPKGCVIVGRFKTLAFSGTPQVIAYSGGRA